MHIAFGKNAHAHLQHYVGMPERDLYYYLINVDEFPTVLPAALERVNRQLEQAYTLLAAKDKLPPLLHAFDYTPHALNERLDKLHQAIFPPDPQEQPRTPLTSQQLHYVLRQYAPLALIDGCWLQNISLAANNHTHINTRLFHIYADKIGDGDTSKHYGKQYQNLLQSAQLYLPEANARLFSTHPDIGDAAFTAPVFQLALSQFPRSHLPELLGFTLGHYFFPQDRLLHERMAELQQQGLDTRYCQHYQQASAAAQTGARLIRETTHLYLAKCDEHDRPAHWQRIWAGLLVHKIISAAWLADVEDAIRTPRILSAHQKMVALMHAKVPHARNMHRHRKVGGHLINDWFAQDPFDAEGFLQALATSPFVNRQHPEKSALLTRSIQFGGPMFRIFTDAEQAVMAEWIHSLSETVQAIDTTGQATAQPALSALVTSPNATPPAKPLVTPFPYESAADLATYAKCNKRQLYYYFVNADLFPDIVPTARKTAEGFFRQAKIEMGKRNLSPSLRFFPYSHTAFDDRIRDIYQTELDAYEAFTPPSTVPREIMVWFTQQYAPFPMVDGSWVQHIAKAGTSQTEISARLFRIYSDEVGNASTQLNHPNVYRQMLEAEGIYMPPTDSLDFAMQPELRDFAFDLPLLTLSISMFPKTFLPEIIGVNLAIELSGLGKGYMQIIDELKFWKMDPYFFTLHLTIDNIASGHTAVAMETVHIYLDSILATQGEQSMQKEWERIWIGYLAFRQNMTRFDATLERQASLRFLIPLIRLKMMRGKGKKHPPLDQAA